MADTLIVSPEGRQRALNVLFRSATVPAAYSMGLIQSGLAVTKDTPSATILGAEATFDTYARIVVGAWAIAGPFSSRYRVTADALLWGLAATPGTGNSIQGYFLFDNTNGEVFLTGIIAGGPVPMAAAGDAVSVTPTVEADSIN